MAQYSLTRELPYGPDRIFDLVADVERYPEFVPGCLSAVVVRRDGEIYITDQTVGFAIGEWHFRTKTILTRPAMIEVLAIDGPFRRFELCWRFRKVIQGRCSISVEGTIEPQNSVLHRLASHAVRVGFGGIADAFEKRAHQLYGQKRSDGEL